MQKEEQIVPEHRQRGMEKSGHTAECRGISPSFIYKIHSFGLDRELGFRGDICLTPHLFLFTEFVCKFQPPRWIWDDTHTVRVCQKKKKKS